MVKNSRDNNLSHLKMRNAELMPARDVVAAVARSTLASQRILMLCGTVMPLHHICDGTNRALAE